MLLLRLDHTIVIHGKLALGQELPLAMGGMGGWAYDVVCSVWWLNYFPKNTEQISAKKSANAAWLE